MNDRPMERYEVKSDDFWGRVITPREYGESLKKSGKAKQRSNRKNRRR